MSSSLYVIIYLLMLWFNYRIKFYW